LKSILGSVGAVVRGHKDSGKIRDFKMKKGGHSQRTTRGLWGMFMQQKRTRKRDNQTRCFQEDIPSEAA